MRPIDADALINDIKNEAEKTIDEGDNAGSFWLSYIAGLVSIQPTAQPEIVRCKDCKYNVSSHKCLYPESFFLVPDDDFYCGYAERRTNATN